MKYFLAGFGGMFLAVILVFGSIALVVIYCPLPPSGQPKFLVFAGMITAACLVVMAIAITAAMAFK